MNAAEIARILGGAAREGREWRCRCPIHGGRSLTLRDGDGSRLLVKCWVGCDPRDVLKELSQVAIAGRHHFDDWKQPAYPRDDDQARSAQALRIWGAAGLVTGTIAETYLGARGIPITELPEIARENLRYHPACRHPSGAELPAMVALVRNPARGAVGVHRTWLRGDGSGKAAVEPVKASLGPVGGGAVRFGLPTADNWLAVTEGIETALSVTVATGFNSWAALSATGVRSLILPPEAKMVLIAADNDSNGVGQRASVDAAQRLTQEGRRVRVVTPELPDTDFNDMLIGGDVPCL